MTSTPPVKPVDNRSARLLVRAGLRRCKRAGLDMMHRVRPITIEGGLASGLRIRLIYASNEYRSGLLELPVQKAIFDALRPGDVFFDIGANVGFFTLVASRAVGTTGSMHAFEPRPDIARAMEWNLRHNDITATVHAVAVGDVDGSTTLHVADHPGGSTIESAKAVDTTRTIRVPVVTIDAAIADGRLPIPNVVKIDVEGAEPAVIRGMSQTLRSARPILVLELDDADANTVEAQFDDMRKMLAAFDYECVRLANSYVDSGWHVIHAVAQHHGQ